jgi:anti-anti-sigma factor
MSFLRPRRTVLHNAADPSARAILFTFDLTKAHTGVRLVLNREIAAVTEGPLIRFDIEESLGRFGSRVTTIKCHGRLLCESAQEIRNLVKPLIQARRRRIVIDCSDLQSLDSSGLGALVSLKVSAFNKGLVKLELVNLSPRVSELLRLTRLTDLFAS